MSPLGTKRTFQTVSFMSALCRMEIVEMLWEVINADGVMHESEGKLAWSVAQSLGITPKDWVKLRKKVEARHA